MNPILRRCPTCGSRNIRLVRSDYRMRRRGRRVVVPDLERQECPDCGEVVLDCAAMERLEARRTGKPRLTHAAK
ncbi:MAG: YgiT-type zinc finger protein [Planctomycetota bacterium]|nr:YgiT-type zinc finger protein [Planctomycetota bacterium]